MAWLFPQIDRFVTRRILAEWDGGTVIPAISHPSQVYSPAGGSRVREAELAELQERVVKLANQFGYPRAAAVEARRNFDRALASLLHTDMKLTRNEAAKHGVWQFMCCVLVPHVVLWRFPVAEQSAPGSRFLGGTRNALSRLWWRAEIFCDSSSDAPYRVLLALNEDELVQIMERPSLAGYRPLSFTLGDEFLRVLEHKRSTRRMEIMREAAKRLLRVCAIVAPEVLDEKQLRSLVHVEIASAQKALETSEIVA
jgi:hypothetical protein